MAKSVDKNGNIKPGQYRDSNQGARVKNVELVQPSARDQGRVRKTKTVQLKRAR